MPQEIVDEIIDYFGVPLNQPHCHDPIFYRWDLDRSALNSWALVSKECNHRVRHYLFSHCKIIATPSFLRKFARCPDVLLNYTRFLCVCRPRSLEEIRSIILRFSSSPLIRVKFVSAQISIGFPVVLGSFLPDVRTVHFEKCLFDPIALVRLRGHEALREVAAGGCVASGILESIEDIRAGIPRKLPDGIGSIDEVVERVLRSLRTLRLESTADEWENELIKVCAKSLEFVEIKIKKNWRTGIHHSRVGFRLNTSAAQRRRLSALTLEGAQNFEASHSRAS